MSLSLASMSPEASFWTATAIFVLAYALIVSEKIHKTIIALSGAALMILLGIVSQEEAFSSPELGVDWNVIFLLFSIGVVLANLVADLLYAVIDPRVRS